MEDSFSLACECVDQVCEAQLKGRHELFSIGPAVTLALMCGEKIVLQKGYGVLHETVAQAHAAGKAQTAKGKESGLEKDSTSSSSSSSSSTASPSHASKEVSPPSASSSSTGDTASSSHSNLPSAEQTVFLTASITKTVIAMLAVQCVERKELDLDQDINELLESKAKMRVVITCE